MTINWRFILSKWWKAALMGLLIAVGVALWPQAQCAVAQTCNRPADRWCGAGKCCDYTGGMKYAECAGSKVSEWKNWPYRCSPDSSGDCNVTDWMGWPYGTRTVVINGVRRTQAYMPNCIGQGVWANVDCCSGGGGGGCTPQYAPPVIDETYTVDPPYPIVWSQEQPPYGLALGMTINDIKAHGGVDTTCGTGQRANITSITINLTLTPRTLDWIFGELSQRYINVQLKGTYPQYPEVADIGHAYSLCSIGTGLVGYNTPDAELDCRFFRPRDPGEYAINVTACQSDGQCTTKTLPNPVVVYLIENTLSGTWR